jgi:hypothetical protein
VRWFVVALLIGCSADDGSGSGGNPADLDATEETSADLGLTPEATPVVDGEPAGDTAIVVDTTPETIADAKPSCLLCEDFETTADGAIPKNFTKVASSGTLAVVSDLAHGGKKSLKIMAPSGSYETYLKETLTFPAKNNTIWGRVWFRTEALMPSDFVHWNLIEARGKTSNNRIRYGGINNPHGGSFFTNAFLFNVETGGSGEKAIDDDPKPEVAAKTWICVEWMFDGTAQEARMFWNGVERPKMHATAPWFEDKYKMPTFDALYLGWAIYQPISKPYEVHLDDIAVGDSRVGCE